MLVLLTVVLLNISSANAQGWENTLAEALDLAQVQNKEVLLFFTVPDACETCSELERRVLKSDVFLEYASQNYILTRIEFRNAPGYNLSAEAKAKNLLIVEKYNKDGFFPLVVLLTKTERVLGKIGVYNYETPEQYLKMLKAFESN